MKRCESRLVFIALLFCTLALMGCTAKPGTLSEEEAYRRFVGTWVNTEYPGTQTWSQVTVIRPDYVGEDWLFPDSPGPAASWSIKVMKTWVDEKGSTYCQFYQKGTWNTTVAVAALMRVDRSGKIFEYNCRPADEKDTSRYLEEIDPRLQCYYVYYRKK